MIPIEYHIYIWQELSQLSCGDTQIVKKFISASLHNSVFLKDVRISFLQLSIIYEPQ